MKTRVQSNAENDSWLERVYKEFQKPCHFKEGISRLIELSENRSIEHITRELQKNYDITASEFMNNLKLDYAASKLRETDKKIIDIILDSGYNSVSYFNRIFKYKFQRTPSRYRKENSDK